MRSTRAAYTGIACGLIMVIAPFFLPSCSNPKYFSERKGDIPFSVNRTNWSGYVRCEDGKKNVFVERHNGIIPLEDALRSVPEELMRKDLAREMIMEEVDKDKYSCSK